VGKLEVAATRDLGGLGAEQGPPVAYAWIGPSVAPSLMPWLAVLAALCLRPNRSRAVWWIWLPLGLLVGVSYTVHLLDASGFMFELWLVLSQLVRALVFGLAFLWLLSPYLAQRGRLGRLTGMLLVLALGSGLSLLAGREWSDSGMFPATALAIGTSLLVLALALSTTAWLCRGRYEVFRVLAWLTLSLVVLCLTAVMTLALGTSSSDELWQLLLASVCLAGLGLILMLPFVLLAFLNSQYRERLQTLLRLSRDLPSSSTVLSPLVPKPLD
jgi:hypothetical protein